MAVALSMLMVIVVVGVLTTVGAQRSADDTRERTQSLRDTRQSVAAIADTARHRAATIGDRAQDALDAYVALDDALQAATGGQNAYADAVNAAVGHYNAGDPDGARAAFASDVRAAFDEVNRLTVACDAAQLQATQARQQLEEAIR
jgi:type II secretory pathway pseudopilin PulG